MDVRVAILQSNYIPWKGYFDLIHDVDHFVLYDDVQYTRRDWRNRNKIKTANGVQWLTLPVQVKGKYFQKISDTLVADHVWAEEHWNSITHAYRRAPHFEAYRAQFASLYEAAAKLERLSDVNYLFIAAICKLLGIETKLHWSSDFILADGKSERLLSICQQLNATEYTSGPAAKDYLQEELFAAEGVGVRWYRYDGYPEYPQLHPPYEPAVTMLDVLFNLGPEATKYMRSFSFDREVVV